MKKMTSIAAAASLLAFAGFASAGVIDSDPANDTQAGADNVVLMGGSALFGAELVPGQTGDVDWFSFTLNDTASLSFFGAFSAGGGDGIMQIVTSGGDVIAFDDDSGVGFMPAIQIESLAAGTYYVGLSGYEDVDSSSVDSDELADGLGHSENFGYKLSVGFTIIPAPGAMALMGMGGLMMVRRRR